MKRVYRGFSVIELIFVIVAIAVFATIFIVQKNNFDALRKDDHTKIAINSIYYSLENVYYAQNGFYPETISPSTLPTVDSALFKDTAGIMINTPGSSYSYSPLNCKDNKCKGYILKGDLINEADYIKTSQK